MVEAWNRVKLPSVSHVCCGLLYETTDMETSNYFRCFAHQSLKKKIANINGDLLDVKFCITFWLACKNNNCITSFTFYYGKSNKIITKTKSKGIDYILKLKDKFLESIPIKQKLLKPFSASKNYLWRYSDSHPRKKYVSNIYNLDDVKVGETGVQKVKILKTSELEKTEIEKTIKQSDKFLQKNYIQNQKRPNL